VLGLRYGLRPTEKWDLPTGIDAPKQVTFDKLYPTYVKGGITELACGSQAFIATLLFDPSMSALPIIPKQNSVSVGLFTHWNLVCLFIYLSWWG
jgi:hypothetical protein